VRLPYPQFASSYWGIERLTMLEVRQGAEWPSREFRIRSRLVASDPAPQPKQVSYYTPGKDNSVSTDKS